MPESRKPTNRKGKVKQSSATPKDRSNEQIFRQPTWNADDMFTINGETLEMFATFLEPYRAMIKMVDAVIASGELENKIQVRHYYHDGALVPSTDPRLAPLVEREQQRLAEWRKIISEKEAQMKQWAAQSQQALEKEDGVVNSALNDLAEFEQEVDNEIPFSKVTD